MVRIIKPAIYLEIAMYFGLDVNSTPSPGLIGRIRFRFIPECLLQASPWPRLSPEAIPQSAGGAQYPEPTACLKDTG